MYNYSLPNITTVIVPKMVGMVRNVPHGGKETA